MTDDYADLGAEVEAVQRALVAHLGKYGPFAGDFEPHAVGCVTKTAVAALAPQLRRGREADEQWKIWQDSSNHFRQRAQAAEQRIAELEAALRDAIYAGNDLAVAAGLLPAARATWQELRQRTYALLDKEGKG